MIINGRSNWYLGEVCNDQKVFYFILMGNLRNILVCGRIMQNVKGKLILLFLLLNLVAHNYDCDDGFGFGFGFGEAVQILSKSRLEKCEKSSTDGNGNGNLNCSHKILINIAVPSKSVSCVF